MRKTLALAAALTCLLLAAAGALAAQEPTPAEAPTSAEQAENGAKLSVQERDRIAEAISRSIMSPFCPGRTVSACPNAGPWRDDIRKWVSEGVSSAEIKSRLAARVPQHNLLGAPKNKLGWALPIGLTVLALGFLVFLMRYLVTPRREDPLAGTGAADAASPPPTSAKATGSEDWDARLDQELDTLEN